MLNDGTRIRFLALRKTPILAVLMFVLSLALVFIGANSLDTGRVRADRLAGAQTEEGLKEHLAKFNAKGLDVPMAINAWITQTYGLSATGDAERDTLVKGCGHRDLVFAQAARAQGLSVRRINFFNIPIQHNHSATEVFSKGAWRFFDSTAGLYFSTFEDDAPIGIAKARRLYPNIKIWRAKGSFALSKVKEKLEVKFREDNSNIVKLPGTDIINMNVQRTYFASEMHGSPERPIHYSGPIVDLEKVPEAKIGEEDGSPNDILDPYFNIGGTSQSIALMARIGKFETMRVGREFQFLSNVPREVTVRVALDDIDKFVMADLDHTDAIFDVASTAIDEKVDGKTKVFRFKVFPPMSRFKLTAKEGDTVYLDALSWSSKAL